MLSTQQRRFFASRKSATFGLALLILSGACVAPTTQLTPPPREAVLAEETIQREVVLKETHKAQERLDRLAYPLLVAALPLCEAKRGYRTGASFGSSTDYRGVWVQAAKRGLDLSDTLSVTHVVPGSPADLAGLHKGDRLLSVGPTSVPVGRGALEVLSRVSATDVPEVRLTIRRDSLVQDLVIRREPACDLGSRVISEGDINAYADGKNIIFTWAIMRFLSDDELRMVIAHEIAHNAMGHIEARQKNALIGGLFGAIADIALATQGVNTGGEHTAGFMRAAATAFSQDFEREADYVGLYIMARAGVPLDDAPNLWRQFAQVNPGAISYASTHPSTAERFVRLRTAIDEIELKRRTGQELLPERRANR